MRWQLLLLAFVCLLVSPLTLQGQTAVAEPPARPEATEKKPAASEPGGDTKKSDRYIRVQTNADGKPQALQTAIVRYRGKKGSSYEGKTVDLVGVVHIGAG